MNYKNLSLDESGKASYNHPSKEFVLCGAIVTDRVKEKLRNQLSKLKKRHFKRDDFVLHYRDIDVRKGSFEVLKDPEIETSFWTDVLNILNDQNIFYLFTVIDKQKTRAKNWVEKTILEQSYSEVIKMFVSVLKKERMKGRIVVESDPSQDLQLIKAHNKFSAKGIPGLKIGAQQYHEMITCLSLVNKLNLDPEIELADLLGTTMRLKYRVSKLGSKETITSIEEKKLRLIDRKFKKNEARLKIII